METCTREKQYKIAMTTLQQKEMITAEDYLLADIYRMTEDKDLAIRMLAIHTVTWWMAYLNIYVKGE